LNEYSSDMKLFQAEIRRVKKFEATYYEDLVTIVDNHIDRKPDISIETCKAILEGLSKLILGELNQAPATELNDKKLAKLFKDARQRLAEEIADPTSSVIYDEELIDACGGLGQTLDILTNSEIVARLGSIRNEHSDISHGRSSRKNQINDGDLAELIIGITDNVCTYMLRKLDQATEKEPRYEDFADFNDFLDRDFKLGFYGDDEADSVISFSQALFEQDYDSYYEQYEDYLLLEEEANE